MKCPDRVRLAIMCGQDMVISLTTGDMEYDMEPYTELLHLEANTASGITRSAIMDQVAGPLQDMAEIMVSKEHPSAATTKSVIFLVCAW